MFCLMKRRLAQEMKAKDMSDEKLMKELGFANLDFLREKRTGAPEAVFCSGKKPDQIAEIMKELSKDGHAIMATRATEKDYAAVKGLIPEAIFHEDARIISVNYSGPGEESKVHERTVAVVTAGTADIPVAEEAAVVAEILGCSVDRIYDVGVAGIHRLFDKIDRIRAAKVVIVVAGMEGALASVVGGLVEAPVIAVPTSIGYGANLEGISALLSMLNSCANGVGIVNIDNGYGAACLAFKILR